MNIKITKEEFDWLKENTSIKAKLIIGSKLYGTDKEGSDTDVLVIYNDYFKSSVYYPNYHQLQYDDIKNNTQWIFTSKSQFYKNLFSGDSTINSDVVLFYSDTYTILTNEEIINYVRTFNIIKAYIGFAKRDIKMIGKSGKHKQFHAERGLYCAEELLNNRLPKLDIIKTLGNTMTVDELKSKEETLRKMCNDLFDKGELTMFPKTPVIEPINELEAKIIEANNFKEFKY